MSERYPDAPGWKARATSREAAEGVRPKASNVRELVFKTLQRNALTADEVADFLGLEPFSVRPRVSELANAARIVDTGGRRKAIGGRNAIVWRARMESAA